MTRAEQTAHLMKLAESIPDGMAPVFIGYSVPGMEWVWLLGLVMVLSAVLAPFALYFIERWRS